MRYDKWLIKEMLTVLQDGSVSRFATSQNRYLEVFDCSTTHHGNPKFAGLMIVLLAMHSGIFSAENTIYEAMEHSKKT